MPVVSINQDILAPRMSQVYPMQYGEMTPQSIMIPGANLPAPVFDGGPQYEFGPQDMIAPPPPPITGNIFANPAQVAQIQENAMAGPKMYGDLMQKRFADWAQLQMMPYEKLQKGVSSMGALNSITPQQDIENRKMLQNMQDTSAMNQAILRESSQDTRTSDALVQARAQLEAEKEWHTNELRAGTAANLLNNSQNNYASLYEKYHSSILSARKEVNKQLAPFLYIITKTPNDPKKHGFMVNDDENNRTDEEEQLVKGFAALYPDYDFKKNAWKSTPEDLAGQIAQKTIQSYSPPKALANILQNVTPQSAGQTSRNTFIPLNPKQPIAQATPTATPTSTPTPLPTPTPTPTPTFIPTSIPTSTPTSTPTAIPTFTPSPSPSPTPTPSPSPTPIPTPTPSPIPTSIPTYSPSDISLPTKSDIPISIPTPFPSPTPSPTPVALEDQKIFTYLAYQKASFAVQPGTAVTFSATQGGPSITLPAGLSLIDFVAAVKAM